MGVYTNLNINIYMHTNTCLCVIRWNLGHYMVKSADYGFSKNEITKIYNWLEICGVKLLVLVLVSVMYICCLLFWHTHLKYICFVLTYWCCSCSPVNYLDFSRDAGPCLTFTAILCLPFFQTFILHLRLFLYRFLLKFRITLFFHLI